MKEEIPFFKAQFLTDLNVLKADHWHEYRVVGFCRTDY